MPKTDVQKTIPTATVAIITRTQNRPLLLRRAIESICNQKYTDWLMVIINDAGDTASVNKLVEEHNNQLSGRIHVIHNKKSKGMEAASNKAIKSCDSTYVVIHDDDDSWHPNFLKETVGYMESNKDNKRLGGTISLTTRVEEKIENEQVYEYHRSDFNGSVEDFSLWRMCAGNIFSPISFLYKRSVFKTLKGMYNEDFPVMGDYEFNLRFMQNFELGVVRQNLAFYHFRIAEEEDSDDNQVYANSITDQSSHHRKYEQKIGNNLLHQDLASDRLSTGGMFYLAHQLRADFDIISQQQISNSTHINQLVQESTKHLENLSTQIVTKSDHIQSQISLLTEQNAALQQHLKQQEAMIHNLQAKTDFQGIQLNRIYLLFWPMIKAMRLISKPFRKRNK